MKTWVVVNDLQIPFQDRPVVSLVLDFLDALRPDGIILNGDILDFYRLSVFDKNPLTKVTLASELEELDCLLYDLRAIRERVFIGGNHEDRFRRYMWKHAPELVGVPSLNLPTLLGLDKHAWHYRSYGQIYQLGKLLVTHGDMCYRDSGMTARAHFAKYGESVLIGHTHRLGAYFKTQRGRPHVAYENGCLCLLTPEYINNPDWQQGFSVVQVAGDGTFAVQQIPIYRMNGEPMFFYGSAIYQ